MPRIAFNNSYLSQKPGNTCPMALTRELALAFALLIPAFVAGLWSGELGWCLFFASLVWISIQAAEYRKVLQWSKRPLTRPQNGRDNWWAIAYPPYRALNRERGRTKAMNAQLREVLGLAEVIPDGVIVLSSTGDIEGMNNAAKALLQLTDADLGLGLATVVRSPDFVSFIRADAHDEPLEFTSPFDSERSFEARRFDAGTGRTIVLVRDITTLNRLLTMRQNFVANVSHELRTPLTVISGYLETMSDTEQPTDLRLELIERLDTPVKRMQTLVADLMLLTQLESTPISQQQQTLRLERVMTAAARELHGLCTDPEQIQFHFETDAPISGIETELHSVCVNLLTNALRYSPEGKRIDVYVTEVGNKVCLAVKDHGYGIAPEHLSRLTERFYRVDMAGARTRGGTGLGLAIVKHVLRRHDSELLIESTLGEGSTFSCLFARAQD